MNNIRPCENNEKWCESCVSKGKCNYTKNQDIIDELEKIKGKIIACTQQEEGEVPACINYGIKLSTEIVEEHIAELKGE